MLQRQEELEDLVEVPTSKSVQYLPHVLLGAYRVLSDLSDLATISVFLYAAVYLSHVYSWGAVEIWT